MGTLRRFHAKANAHWVIRVFVRNLAMRVSNAPNYPAFHRLRSRSQSIAREAVWRSFATLSSWHARKVRLHKEKPSPSSSRKRVICGDVSGLCRGGTTTIVPKPEDARAFLRSLQSDRRLRSRAEYEKIHQHPFRVSLSTRRATGTDCWVEACARRCPLRAAGGLRFGWMAPVR